MLCFAGVAVLGAIPGIALAVIVAVIDFCGMRGGRIMPFSVEAEGVKGYHDITRYPEARLIPGLVLFRWDAPSFSQMQNCFRSASLTLRKILRLPYDGWSWPRSP